MNFTAIDFETANRNRSSICSIGLAYVRNWKVVKTEHILVKPSPNYYELYNTLIHRIDDNMTKNEKTFKQLWGRLKPAIENQIIVAHNASFDMSCLRYILDMSNLKYPDLDYACTYRLAKEAITLPKHDLHKVSGHFKIELNHHHAESDANACALIALKLMKKYKTGSLHELSEKLGFKMGKIISQSNSYQAFSFY